MNDMYTFAGDDDGDGIPDHLDPDDDNDGIPDFKDDDDDNDGILDEDEGSFWYSYIYHLLQNFPYILDLTFSTLS